MKKRIVITGAKGVIGTVLTKRLKSSYKITPINLPKTDVRNYQQLLEILPKHNAIIHLAWDDKTAHENITMFENVFKAALATGVKRVIMASSVHADRFDNWNKPEKMSPYDTPNPNIQYGNLKVKMESMGKYYVSKGLEVVCIRFGGINSHNAPVENPSHERAVWLSHDDCISLIKIILEADSIPNNFVVMYAISDNPEVVHDISNPFQWKPKDSAGAIKQL